MAGKQNMRQPSVHDLPQQAGAVPAWMQRMREAALGQISETDIEEIVQAQIKRAKEGNPQATKFVFEQILGGSAFKGSTFVQHVTNHHYGTDQPDQPTKARGGTDEKIEAMAARVAQGVPIFNEDDGPEIDLD